MRDPRNIPHAEEVGRAPLAKEQMNTSRVSDEEGPYAQARKGNTSRLIDEKNPHV